MIDTRTGQSASEKTDGMASHREIEVKLRTDPAKFAKIRRSPWWRGLERLHRQSLHSVYYDTTDHRLRDNNISLRTRTDGHSFVQTLKLLERGIGLGQPRRSGKPSIPDPIPDPSLVDRSGIAGRFPQAHVRGPATGVRCRGQAGNAARDAGDDAQIDVSLDQGTVIAGRRQREAVHEIELELVIRRPASAVRGGAPHRRSGRWTIALTNQGRHRLRARRQRATALLAGGEAQPEPGNDGRLGNPLHFIVHNSLSHLTV